MDDNKTYIPEQDDIEPDMAFKTANELGLDMMDFCINQIDIGLPFMDEPDHVNEISPVSAKSVPNLKKMTYNHRPVMTTMLNLLAKKAQILCLGKNGCLQMTRMAMRSYISQGKTSYRSF